jgi:S-adenosylmethionine synthetase
VQIAYAIGVARPVGIYVNTYERKNVSLTDGAIAAKIVEIFDLRPAAIEKRLKLRNPIYLTAAAYGHMGRTPATVTRDYISPYLGEVKKEVELFTWEKLDYVEKIRKAFIGYMKT